MVPYLFFVVKRIHYLNTKATVITTSSAAAKLPEKLDFPTRRSGLAAKEGKLRFNLANLLQKFFFRADKCFAFVAEKPWRSGITKYGK